MNLFGLFCHYSHCECNRLAHLICMFDLVFVGIMLSKKTLQHWCRSGSRWNLISFFFKVIKLLLYWNLYGRQWVVMGVWWKRMNSDELKVKASYDWADAREASVEHGHGRMVPWWRNDALPVEFQAPRAGTMETEGSWLAPRRTETRGLQKPPLRPQWPVDTSSPAKQINRTDQSCRMPKRWPNKHLVCHKFKPNNAFINHDGPASPRSSSTWPLQKRLVPGLGSRAYRKSQSTGDCGAGE